MEELFKYPESSIDGMVEQRWGLYKSQQLQDGRYGSGEMMGNLNNVHLYGWWFGT